MPLTFDDDSKLRAIEREIKLREIVYPRRIARGLLNRSTADYEIAVMRAIAEDYRLRVNQMDLFGANKCR